MSTASRPRNRGYLISENDELALRLSIDHKRGIAAAIQGPKPGRIIEEIAADDLAAIFLSLAAAEEEILKRATFFDFEGHSCERQPSE